MIKARNNKISAVAFVLMACFSMPATANACIAAPEIAARPVAHPSVIDQAETVFIGELLTVARDDKRSSEHRPGYRKVFFSVKKTLKGDPLPEIVAGWESVGLTICPRYVYLDGPVRTVVVTPPETSDGMGTFTFYGVDALESLGVRPLDLRPLEDGK